MGKKDHAEVGVFPSTHWSLISSARADDADRRRAAIDNLWRLYLPALRAHLLYRRRIEASQTEDLLQGFVIRQVLEHDLLAKADADRGRFRSFLLKSLENYVFTKLQPRGRRETAFDAEPQGSPVADVFELEWARQILREALGRMKRECRQDGQAARWDLFECRVIVPTLTGSPPPAYQSLVERFGFRTPEQASNALVTAKRQFERTLRAVIAETERALTDEEIDAEIAELCATLHRTGPLGLQWDHQSILGPEKQDRESLPALDESRPSELASLLSVRGTPHEDWQPQEMRDLLRHGLETLVGDYLETGDDAEQPGKPRGHATSEETAVSITLRELLQIAKPPLGLLMAVKRHARHLAGSSASHLPDKVHRLVYFATIAAAMLRHGQSITKSSAESVRIAFARMAAEPYVEEWLRTLFESAGKRFSDG
jgi:RNA polymerase sigma-70 factor (ECF subfamily)